MKALRNPKSLCVCDTFECRNDAAVTALSSSSCHGPSSVSATPDSICAALYHSNCCHFMTCLNEALSITVVRCDSLINGGKFLPKNAHYLETRRGSEGGRRWGGFQETSYSWDGLHPAGGIRGDSEVLALS